MSGSAIGMHQGNCPGYAASHGCIRMPWSSSKSLYYKTKVGDIVVVQH
ncbi:MAG: L,D-transpeptidase family protein [Verrucomicrobiota bacterium]